MFIGPTNNCNVSFMNDICEPTFVVGCGHSGTSLMLTIIGAHSRIMAIPFETYFAFGLPDSEKEVSSFFEKWNSIAHYFGKNRLVEKTPRHIWRLHEIITLFPSARIVIMIRDGRDVACSLQDRYKDIKSGINRWIKDNNEGQKYWTHPNVHCVRYEALIENPEKTIKETMSFLGEPYEETMLEYYKRPRYYYHGLIEKPVNGLDANHRLLRNWQINQPLFDGRGKWKRMTDEEKQLVKRRAGQMLIEYGYADTLSW